MSKLWGKLEKEGALRVLSGKNGQQHLIAQVPPASHRPGQPLFAWPTLSRLSVVQQHA